MKKTFGARLKQFSLAALLAASMSCVHAYTGQNQDNIGHIRLEMERVAGTTDSDHVLLDEIISEAPCTLALQTNSSYADGQATNILAGIHTLLEQKGFTYELGSLFNQGLKDGKIDCDRYVTLYLSIAEKYGLPLRGIDMPRHSLIAWQTQSNNPIYWECTSGFAYDSLESALQICSNRIGKSIEISDVEELTREELIARMPAYSSTNLTQSRAMVSNILAHLERAVAQEPTRIERRTLLMDSYMNAGQFNAARTACEAILAIEPRNITAQRTLFLLDSSSTAELENMYSRAWRVNELLLHYNP